MRLVFLILIVFSTFHLSAQVIPPPSVDYRSPSNPYYWKLDPPEPDYWQQDVHYEIEARLDDSTNIIHGDNYKLTYYNNSPHSLTNLFFHLYQNAFVQGSHYHDLNVNNNVVVKFGQYENEGLGTTYENLRVDGESVKTELDNTILKVFLNEPLEPGDSLVVTMNFKTYFDKGSLRRRMKMFESFGNNHYDGVHWYPAIAVYDRQFGWTTDQHLDKEFYSNFGQFDVWLTLPQQYIVDATGYLMNEDEVLPPELKEKLRFSNYQNRPKGEPADPLVPVEPGKTKTWYFKAINVHNFAFTADPDYRKEVLTWNGIDVVALVEEPNVPGWKGSLEFTQKIIEVYSKDFGMYIWPKIIIADAKDGMEYPMLTLDNGTYPGNQSLIAHEVGHMWFYGMLGTNETYRAFMDEGFTQFLTVWSMDKLLGEERRRIGKSNYVTRFLEPSITRQERLYYPYINHVITGWDDQLNTHSSAFNGALRHGGNYGLVYYKAGTMLYNLRYVLGEDLFQEAMQHYVNKWKIAHPYPQDFREAIIEYTGVDLNWFFDQWIETTKYIDYGIDKVKHIEDNKYSITFSREGRMQMPIEFRVTTTEGEEVDFLIPNTWFEKETDAEILPRWYGWDLLHPEYTAVVDLPGKVSTVEIDPDHYLADIDLRDNKVGEGGISEWEFDSRVPNYPQWTKQKNYYRPDIWWNNYDGIKLGLHLEGGYLKHMNYSATGWVNTRLLTNDVPLEARNEQQWLSFRYSFENSLTNYWRGMKWNHNGYFNAGIWNFGLGIEKEFRRQDARNKEYSKVSASINYLYNEETYKTYLLYSDLWGPDPNAFGEFLNASFNLSYLKHYDYGKGNGDFIVAIRTPFIESDYNYSRVNLTSINLLDLAKFQVRSRVFGQVGFGDFPLESQLYLSGANPEELIGNKFTRAKGFVPLEWTGYNFETNHFHYGGGLNLRGYAGYLAPEIEQIDGNEVVYYSYRGTSGAAWNLELDFDKYIKIKPKNVLKNLHFDTYLFTDLGIIGSRVLDETEFGNFRMDAGIGTAMTIKFSYFDINPLTLRFDMPLFLNRPPEFEEYFEFRYVIGVSRAF